MDNSLCDQNWSTWDMIDICYIPFLTGTPLCMYQKSSDMDAPPPPPPPPRRKNFPESNFSDEARETVSRDKPKKRVFASHDIAKERVFNVL